MVSSVQRSLSADVQTVEAKQTGPGQEQVCTFTDPGWSPTLFEGVCNFNVQSGLLSDQHGTPSLTWLSNHGVIRVKCLTQDHNKNSLGPVGFELSIL